ncbi:MAG: hypothetical protein DRJ42_09605 [Deltaproteobacteria bacterium]|nr:MAG: hypothetical protein DRJ42_09605 [Deltaproteobacteria bacterium]
MIQKERESIGPFRVTGIVGRGGMGAVYRCVDDEGAELAVKVLLPERTRPDMLKRFAREAAIRIDHPNVVEVRDAGTDSEGAPWIAFELLEGESLQERLRRGPLRPAEAIEVIVATAKGVGAAHAVEIVHRDLKPANIFICEDGQVKVLDFGIARWTEVEPELTIDKEVLGTPAYLAPEQARAEPDVDERADVWALGVVLYECLTGRRPFKRDSPVATMLALVLDEPRPIRSYAPHVPRRLVEVVSRAMRKTRAGRWASMMALVEALGRVDVSGATGELEIKIPTDAAISEPMTRAGGENLSRPSRASTGIAVDEKRVVAMLYAANVTDANAIEKSILDQGGVFVPLLGSKAIGVFGGESWEGDEVERAARAARAIVGAAGRISVASGRASTRDGRGVSGEAVREAEAASAKRLDGVIVLGETGRSLSATFEVEEVESGVFRLGAERAEGGGESPPATPTIGRDVEIAQLQRGFDACIEEERGALMMVVGPPGSGKSRMRYEMERIIEDSGEEAEVLVGRGAPLRKDTSLSLLANALTQHARRGAHRKGWPSIDATADLAERQRGVVHLVSRVIRDPAAMDRCATFLGAMLGVPMEQNQELSAAMSDARLMADQLQATLYEYFVALASQGPVFLILEDLQWGDPASMEMIEGLADRTADYPMMILVTARPEVADGNSRLFARHDAVRLDLPRLSIRDVAKLANTIVNRPIPDAVIEAVAERSGGNPLFIEQIIRVLAEDGLLDSPPDRLPLPRSVEAAVQSRLDHLPGPEKDLCKQAALYGRPFVSPEVEALGSGGSNRLLGSLRRRGLIVAGPRPPDGSPREHRFRSSLLADVAYRMLSDDLRQELHRRAARYLGNTGRIAPEEIAVHYERGSEASLAAAHYADAALLAARQGDNATVLRCGKQAEKLGAPEDKKFPLHMAQAEALGFLGRRDDQGLELAEALHAAPGDRERARVMIAQATWLMRTSSLEDAAVVAREAVENADRVGDAELRGFSRVRQIAALVYTGKLDDAGKVLSETEPLFDHLSVHTQAFVVEARALLAASRGDLGQREIAFRTAAELFRQTGDVRRAAANESNLADTYNRFGAYEQALQALRDALDGCRQVGNRLGESYALLNLAYALGMLDHIDQALRTIEEARALPHLQEDPRLMLTLRLYRARILLQAIDDPERVAGLAEEAPRLAHDAGKAGMAALRVGALAIASKIRLHEGEVELALSASTQAMIGRDELQSIEEDEAEVFLAHSEALAAAGRHDDAKQVTERGIARLEYIAQRIADPAVRKRFLEDVPAHRALMAAGEALGTS